MRLFIALDISEEIRRALAEYAARLRRQVPSARFVRVEGLHITLKFIGETQKAESLQQALSTIQQAPFEVALAGTGFFPDAKRPRIFWAGIQAPAALPELARKVEAACRSLGFPAEERPFQPHLTLARGGSGNPHQRPRNGEPPLLQLANAVRKEESPRFGMMVAQQFHLYESQLHPEGSIYTKIATFDLKPAP
jgi:RNA 2',3'-cyclic 3'-phosphodiesterase